MRDIGIGVLSKEVEITVEIIKGISENSHLSSSGVIWLTLANEFAKGMFAGSHGLTDNGHLVSLSEEKRILPHSCENLFLDVGECAVGLINLQTLLTRTPLEKILFKGIDHLSIQTLHFHRINGAIVSVSMDKFGIILSG